MTEIQTTARNAALADLRTLLETQRLHRVDLVASTPAFRTHNAMLVVDTDEVILSDAGVTPAGGVYRPTATFDDGLSDKLGINRAYLARLRDERPDLYDANVNGWLHGRPAGHPLGDVPADPRRFLLRMFSGDDGYGGIARAFLSDSYKPVDHLDVLVSALDGVRQAGIDVQIPQCNLTERRMYVEVAAPQVCALAPTLLKGYRSPFTGASADDNPVVFAGFVITNSETGDGRFLLVPKITIQVCSNGAAFTADAVGGVHLGGKRGEGIVRYSADTMEKELAVVTGRARDAVRTFLDTRYVETKIAEMEGNAAVEVAKPEATVKAVIRAATIPTSLENDVFAAFIKGGQMTAGGIMQAVTATAQTVEDADLAADLEAKAVEVLAHAARIASR